jgi:hypothetical protein
MVGAILAGMEKLAFPFARNGFAHELLERRGQICLVKRSKDGHSHFEVVKLQHAPDQERFGKFYAAHELYPSSETWGLYGFTYLVNDLDGAHKCFKRLARLAAGPIFDGI